MTRAEQLAIELGAPLGDRDGTKLVPMLCGRDDTGERVLGSEGFTFELKLDGVRIVADKRGDRVSLGYRKLRDATSSYPEIAEAVAELGEDRVVLDGEVVAFDEDGKPDFQRLGTRIQARGSGARRARMRVPVVYVVFDVLVVGGRDVTGLPLESRKKILERVLEGASERTRGYLRLHPTFDDGQALFRLCRAHGLEGVVAKRAGSTYRPDERAADWVKVKCELDVDLVVVGWTEGEGKRSALGALDLAAYDGERLVVRGSVGSGLDEALIDELLEKLTALEVREPTAVGRFSRVKRGRHFTKPELVVSVRYMGISSDGFLRHPVFRGLRHDLAPSDCVVEAAPVGDESRASRAPRRRATAPSLVVLADGTTKGALCSYYEAVATVMLPPLRGRICPVLRADGKPAWPLPEWTPAWVRTAVVARGAGATRGVLVDGVDTLRFLVEAGYASLLLTPMREDSPASADFVALRLVGAAAWQLALRARDLVEATGLSVFVQGASSSVLELLVPIGGAPAPAASALAALFTSLLAGDAERLGVAVEPTSTPAAPYAVVLPVAGTASVSLPHAWDELGPDLDLASRTTLAAVTARAARDGLPPAGPLDGPARFAEAVHALERLVREQGDKDRSFVRDPAAR